MRQINLLPTEFRPGRQVNLAVKKAERVILALLGIYIIVAVAALAATYYLGKKLKTINVEKQALSAELKGLPSVENSTVYIRDRVTKYKLMENKDIEMKNYGKFNESLAFLPADAKITDVSISGNSVTYSVGVGSVQSFSYVLKQLADSQIYKDILVSGISYRQNEGYVFNLAMSF